MNILTLVFLGMSLLFGIMLVFKKLTGFRFCALCASVSLTWVTLLLLYWLDLFDDLVLVALLIGGSVVGIYYWLEKSVIEKLLVFRLPTLVTLFVVGSVLLGNTDGVVSIIVLLLVLWTLFGFLYAYKNNEKVIGIVQQIIACCRDW